MNLSYHLVQGGHFVFLDNAPGFHEAVFYACRQYLSGDSDISLPADIQEVKLPKNAAKTNDASNDARQN